DFVGRAALTPMRGNQESTMVGLLLEGRGVLRAGQRLRAGADGETAGVLTSGSYAPTLERSIGLARVPRGWAGTVQVEMRRKWQDARIVSYPFVRQGEIKTTL